MTKILIVVDMQNDFVDGSLGTKEAVGIVGNVVEKIKTFDGDNIIATLDTHTPDYLQTLEGMKLPVVHCVKMTKGWLINEEVLKALNDKKAITIQKQTFAATRLVNKIRKLMENDKDIEVTLIGLCTDVCVVSNAILLKAHFPNIKIVVDASCCAGVTPESHKAALTTMRACQIDVIGE
jgi:nicotinamidase-related amidase